MKRSLLLKSLVVELKNDKNIFRGERSIMKTIKSKLVTLVAILVMATGAVVAAPAKAETINADQVMQRVRKEIVTLPFYGVFDNLAYKVDGSTVTLHGQVVRPTTRSDAESRVKRIPGVERVVNNIEVLPLSPYDDDIRVRTYYTVFGTSNLYRYAMSANPSIHIVVNRGRVTLEGVVANKADKQLAYIAARSVPGVFEVVNNLRAEDEKVS